MLYCLIFEKNIFGISCSKNKTLSKGIEQQNASLAGNWNHKMSWSTPPFLDAISASQQDDLNIIVPELFIQPPTPRLPTEAIEFPWTTWTTTRRLSLSTMHESRSENRFDGLNPPLTRDRRSQSVPLSLDAVSLSKKIVFVSDKFEAKHQAVKMRVKERSRTLSGSESPRSMIAKRRSDLIEEWLREKDELSPQIGSPV